MRKKLNLAFPYPNWYAFFRYSKEGRDMHARTLKIQLNHDRIDEASELFSQQVLPLCENMKGYKGGQFLADRKTGICLMITMWETEEDMRETERSRFFQEQIIKFVNLFIKPPIREIYEVLYRE